MSVTNTLIKVGIGAAIVWWFFGRNKASAATPPIVEEKPTVVTPPTKPYVAYPPYGNTLPPYGTQVDPNLIDPVLIDPAGLIKNDTNRCISRCNSLQGTSI